MKNKNISSFPHLKCSKHIAGLLHKARSRVLIELPAKAAEKQVAPGIIQLAESWTREERIDMEG